jgi:propanol-preferring alcohol dehydrogenase
VKSLVLVEAGAPLVAEEREIPTADKPGEEIVKVIACGVCHSDIHVADGHFGGPLPLVLGHEVVGEHAELGRVLVYAPWGCRQPECRQCSAGLEMICANSHEAGVVDDGGYSEYMKVPSRDYLIPIGDLDPATTAPLACGGLTAFRAVKRTLPHLNVSGAKALIIGAGGLGQFAVQFIKKMANVELTVLDLSEDKRAASLELGADHAVSELPVGVKYDAIIDFVGANPTLQAGAGAVNRQGILVVVGLAGGRLEFGVGVIPSEAVLTTSIWGSLSELTELLDFVRAEGVEHLVETMPLNNAQEALDRLRSGDVRGRVVLNVSP